MLISAGCSCLAHLALWLIWFCADHVTAPSFFCVMRVFPLWVSCLNAQVGLCRCRPEFRHRCLPRLVARANLQCTSKAPFFFVVLKFLTAGFRCARRAVSYLTPGSGRSAPAPWVPAGWPWWPHIWLSPHWGLGCAQPVQIATPEPYLALFRHTVLQVLASW